ncbi:hypothetical protein Poli38472_000410 [Pythium oligandrum]|uniref:Uncharacterized protein n=1 Tax=Pythium oligandrum TaxID=41045 RepID=A0A8K1CD09_PYTOL|nr:hypothetical protein Poli38472_000410 [Pythium oligandrum]|eukprot:TMW60368.1 hypothetical protein Poli38472_000410 [Pythium oligandrum]
MTDAEGDVDKTGTFSVALQSITQLGANASDVKSFWGAVQVEDATGAPLETFWFLSDDENVMTKSVELFPEEARELEYLQNSRAVPLTKASMDTLMWANVRVFVYAGTTRSKTTDECFGSTTVAFLPAMLGERVSETLSIRSAAGDEEIHVGIRLQCDVDLLDFALGARVLRLHSLTITNIPTDWTIPSETDDDAVKNCGATERNPAIYELDVHLPDCYNATTSYEAIRFTSGKLVYEPGSSAVSEEEPAPGLTGNWLIVFPPPASSSKLYLKPALDRLVDYLHVEKALSAVLRRTNVDHNGRVSASLQFRVADLVLPGTSQLAIATPIKRVLPLPKEALEQELANATANEEKKRLQALINDYDTVIAQAATTLSTAMKHAKTSAECAIQVLNTPLLPLPPPNVAPGKRIDELIPSRDLMEEFEQHKDVISDLRTELRHVVLSVLREYEDQTTNSQQNSGVALLAREDKRQRIIFNLNSKGTYHEFKEKLKKRIVPLIRERFAPLDDDDNNAAEHEGTMNGAISSGKEGESSNSRVNAKKKEYFAQLFASLMEHVHAILHETFYANATALEKAHADQQPRDEQKITSQLQMLWLQALENEVNGDINKSETKHLDRIAFAEARSLDEQAAGKKATTPSLSEVWYDYATFCLRQNTFEKAGSALRQCLALDASGVSALLAYGALLCELRDYVTAEEILKNAVAQSLKSFVEPEHTITGHALLALYYSQSGRDSTGNLALFELLKAQSRLSDVSNDGQPPCLSAIWIFLADKTHKWRLRGITQVALGLSDQYHKSRDVLTREERVLKRVIHAEMLSNAGEGDAAMPLLQEALLVDDTHPLARLVQAKTYLQLESQTQAAIDALTRALDQLNRLQDTERCLSVYVHLGLALLQTSQFSRAKETFLCASEAYATASHWLGVAIACFRLEDADGARLALAGANRLDACNPEIWGYMALVALSRSTPTPLSSQQEANAKRFVAQALRYQLRNPVLLRELSSAFVALDRLEDAEKLLRRVLVYQDSSLTRKTLADVLAAQNCAEDALMAYKRSLDECQNVLERAELLEKCAELLVTLGRPDEAHEYRQMADQFTTQQIVEEPMTLVQDTEPSVPAIG